MGNRRPVPIAILLEIVAAVALGVPVIRYALAFQLAEPALMIGAWALDISWLTGLLFGLTYEGAVYLGIREAFRAWKDGVTRWWLPLPVVSLQIIAGIAIIAPVVEATQAHVELSAVLGAWSWPWSVVLTGATALTLVTLAVTRTLRKDVPVTLPMKKSTTIEELPQSNAIAAQLSAQSGNGDGKRQHALALLASGQFNQKQVAEQVGVHPATVSKWRHGGNGTGREGVAVGQQED